MSRALIFLALLAAFLAPRHAGAAVPGVLAVTPATGPVGTTFIVTGVGFTGRSAVRLIVLHLFPIASGGAGEQHVVDRSVPVAADGTLTLRVDSADFAPDNYLVLDEAAPGQTATHFTVIGGAAPLPGLPNTGGGGMSHRPGMEPCPPRSGSGRRT